MKNCLGIQATSFCPFNGHFNHLLARSAHSTSLIDALVSCRKAESLSCRTLPKRTRPAAGRNDVRTVTSSQIFSRVFLRVSAHLMCSAVCDSHTSPSSLPRHSFSWEIQVKAPFSNFTSSSRHLGRESFTVDLQDCASRIISESKPHF